MTIEDKIDIINPLSKLNWACRRGMLELDVLLGNFLNEAYLALTREDQALFTRLLSYKDPDLFAWLMGQEEPAEASIARMIGLIRQHARSRISV